MTPLLLLAPALALDPAHAGFQAVLDARLRDGRVDYAGLRADPARLDAYLAEIASVRAADLSVPERTALWINAYNALTLDLIADSWPLASIRDLDGGRVWNTRRFAVGGETLTLDELENRRLRPLGDARVHAALNCASLGCAPLPPKVFTGAGLDAQLDEASRRWVATVDVSGPTVAFSKIFDWYGEDFTGGYGPGRFDIPGLDGKLEAAANFVAAYAPDKATRLRAGGYRATWAEYDWRVNGR